MIPRQEKIKLPERRSFVDISKRGAIDPLETGKSSPHLQT
jgi:hypothetical protein